MSIGTPLESIASSIYACIHNKEIMADVKNEHRGRLFVNRPSYDDLTIYSFPQLWGSTALGFGGMGGAAMSTATTVVIYCEALKTAAIFFAGRWCYSVDNPTEIFWDDVRNWKMASLEKAIKY